MALWNRLFGKNRSERGTLKGGDPNRKPHDEQPMPVQVTQKALPKGLQDSSKDIRKDTNRPSLSHQNDPNLLHLSKYILETKAKEIVSRWRYLLNEKKISVVLDGSAYRQAKADKKAVLYLDLNHTSKAFSETAVEVLKMEFDSAVIKGIGSAEMYLRTKDYAIVGGTIERRDLRIGSYPFFHEYDKW